MNTFVTVDFNNFANETLQGLQGTYKLPKLIVNLKYVVTVISVSQTVSTSTSTSPPPPSIIPSYPGEVHTDSAIVRWLAPPKLPADVSSVSYELVKDEDLVASAISEEFLLVENLAANTNYEFRVKALTDTGLESQWSQPFSLKTLDEGDELSHFSETISGKF